MRFIGIDLAWGKRNTTAAVALQSTENGLHYLAHEEALTDNTSILNFVTEQDDGEGLIIAVDAPTLVPNVTGRRPCEGILARCLHKEEAGPHPANRTLLADSDGNIRGEELVALFAERLGIVHTPYIPEILPRIVFEAFPHPAHIALFGLSKTLKYKNKPGRDRVTRNAVFREYAAFLASLAGVEPALHLETETVPWFWRDPAEFTTEAALKRHEDLLDALTCAYVAAYHYRWQGEKTVVLGNLTEGYIVIPATTAMQSRFSALVNGAQSAVQ